MMKKCTVGMVLVMALVLFSFVHEGRADAGFGDTSSVASWGASRTTDSVACPPPKPQPVPEPATLILLACGLLGVVALRIKMRGYTKPAPKAAGSPSKYTT